MMNGQKKPDVKATGSSTMDEILQTLLNITRVFLFPSFLAFNELLIPYFPTFEDKKNGERLLITKIFHTLVCLCLMTLTLPLTVIFFPLRIILLSFRKPYHYSIKRTALNTEAGRTNSKRNTTGSADFCVASMNILLLPEYAARHNNKKNVKWRSKEIGERVVSDQLLPQNRLNASNHEMTERLGNQFLSGKDKEVVGKIKTHFSHLDFVCIQEAFSNYHVKTLKRELHKTFPYIVYDVGVHSFNINKFVFNSGLMIASRHSIAAIDFRPFTDFLWPGTTLSKGLLMVKVVVGSDNAGVLECQRVGYIFNTHLQVFHGGSGVVQKQLDEIMKWSNEFMLRTKNPGDQELFSILCGDFNSDNMSPGDREIPHHECFKIFTDYGRTAPGVEKEWTVGTELRHKSMSDPIVSTPESLKTVLEDPSLRRQYIGDATIEISNPESFLYEDPPTDANGRVIPSTVGGRRRVDLIMFHSKYPVRLMSYDFVTCLASLTDHISIQTSFSCDLSRTMENKTTHKAFDEEDETGIDRSGQMEYS